MEEPTRRRWKVLIVDDEPGLTRLLKLNLEGIGHYVVREENRGTQALKAAREFQPDLILLDIIMPDISGGDVAAQFQADPRLKHTSVIFLTALISREQAERASQAGGEHYLAKPVTFEELIHSIRRRLDAHATDHYSYLAKPFTVEELLQCVGKCLQSGQSPRS